MSLSKENRHPHRDMKQPSLGSVSTTGPLKSLCVVSSRPSGIADGDRIVGAGVPRTGS